MRAIQLNNTFDLYDNVKEIIINPVHKDHINLYLDKVNKKMSHNGVFFMRQPKITYDARVDAKAPIGPWKRTNRISHPLIEYIDNLEHPSSWAIYFGLVKRRLVDICYVIEHKSSFLLFKNQYDFNSIYNQRQFLLKNTT